MVPMPPIALWARHVWSDFPLQLQHGRCCRTPAQLKLLLELHYKVNPSVGSSYSDCWAKLKHWQQYDKTASIIACSNYAKREDFIRCGDSTFKCRDRLLCPRCCYRRSALPLLREFGDAFSADQQVWFIVISLSRDPVESHRLIYRDVAADELHEIRSRSLIQSCSRGDFGVEFDTFDDIKQCRLVWDFTTNAVREFTGDRRGDFFSGAVGGPELAVQFQPLRVLPHANYLVWSPDFSIEAAYKFRKYIRTRMRDCRPLQGGIYPSLACYRLPTADDLRHVVKYMVKPIALATAYTIAAELAKCEPAKMIDLNRQVNDFLSNLLFVFHRLNRVSRHVRCLFSNPGYIGRDTPWRSEQRRRDAERRLLQRDNGKIPGRSDFKRRHSKKSSVEKWEARIRPLMGRQAPPRHSQHYYWRRWNDPPPPPPPPSSRPT